MLEKFTMETEKKKTGSISAIVIDDDTDIVELISEFLELANVQVLGKGYSGKDAVELYEKVRPDVVLLDIMMPDYDGFYALEKIRLFDTNAKILMVTADLRRDTLVRLTHIEGLEIVLKPFDFNKVLSGIHNLYEGHTNARVYHGASYVLR